MLDERSDPLELGRRLMRAHTARRRELERELETVGRALDRVLVAFVETIEHLEGLLETAAPEKPESSAALRLALRQAVERLEDAGIEIDGAPGEPFDPRRHRVVENLTASEGEDLVVVRVLSRGITALGRRSRPADVVVRRKLDGGAR